VVCGRLEVIATLVPTSALVSVDLPALGRPTKQANPERKVTGAFCLPASAPVPQGQFLVQLRHIHRQRQRPSTTATARGMTCGAAARGPDPRACDQPTSFIRS